MKGLIGRKLGMTSVFTDDGSSVPCTLIEAGPCYVTAVKTKDNDGCRLRTSKRKIYLFSGS